MAVQNKDVTYINKDFNDIRAQLINFSQTYFPNTYTDFSPASPGMMFIEQAAYVSDVLSFYLDNQIQENYIQYAKQTNNLFNLAYMFSYKPKVTGLASVDVDIYQQIPSKVNGTTTVPDFSYALYIDNNTNISSNSGNDFVIQESVDFSVSNSIDPTDISISQINGGTGEPEFYLLKKKRKATSGTITTQTFTLGAYEEFPTIELNTSNIAGIIDIFDSDGNPYYEVDYLAQDLIYDSIKNTNINDPNNYTDSFDTPYLLKTKYVNRRFTTRFLSNSVLQIQFGAGKPTQTDEEVIPNPDNVGIGLPFDQDKLTTAFSPTNFIFTDTYGIAPSNTTLTVRYLTGGGVQSNIDANTLTTIDSSLVTFASANINNSTLAQFCFNSIAVNNPIAASGGQDGDSIEEIRQNSLSNYNTQQRNVTADDYLVRALSMPPKFGIISKAITQKPNPTDTDSILDLYVLSYDKDKKLTNASDALKSNLQTYINQYRMIGDTVNIKNAFVINIAVEFDIITLPNFNNNEVLSNCIVSLREYFSINKWQINQPIILKNITTLIDAIPGVQTVNNLQIINKAGTNTGYSQYAYGIQSATQGGIIYPSLDPSIFEVKYPDTDIKGRISSIGTGTLGSVGGGMTGVGSY